MTKLRALIICHLFLFSCSFIGQTKNEEILPGDICGLEGFTMALDEHIIDEIKQPIVVRTVKGRITNEQGGWPKKWPVLFEIRRIERTAETTKVYADSEGNFRITDVAEGRYCFKATANGWQSVIGLIKVDKRASPQKTIIIMMKIGV